MKKHACVRNGRKIHSFDKVTISSAGIFMPQEDHWDLRTLKLLDYIEKIENKVLCITKILT
ncbi:hypothetical protein HZS_5250 [Henneguya salminicola]|nr:hypothetical protein HZS_5250 [Henneguya salminicola]